MPETQNFLHWGPQASFPSLYGPFGGRVHPPGADHATSVRPRVRSIRAVRPVSAEVSLGPRLVFPCRQGLRPCPSFIPSFGDLCVPFFSYFLSCCQRFVNFIDPLCFLIDYLCCFSVLNSSFFFCSYLFMHSFLSLYVRMCDRVINAFPPNGLPGGSQGKESACNAGDLGWIPGSRIP